MKKTIMISILGLYLNGCAFSTDSDGSISQYRGKVAHKRIDTAQCKDADDWYLDGYRVGKSFRTEKKQMWLSRENRCKSQLGKAVPKQFKKNWEKGFGIGVKS